MIYLWLTLFILFLVAAWFTNLIGVPGNWIIVAGSLLWFLLAPVDYSFSLWILLAQVLLAGIGEALEAGASIVGARKLGGSKTGAAFSLIGSIIGGIAGLSLIPIPVIGWIVGPILFACVGALLGAILGEKLVGTTTGKSLKIGGVAFAGRLFGTLGKLAMGSAMVVVTLIATFTQ